jgi:ABC-type glycerol-3-phosphate transport system permease component
MDGAPGLGGVRDRVHPADEPDASADLVGILDLQRTYATNSTGILAAGSVIAVLPAILLFVLLQRFIVGAFVRGALKG